MPGTSGMRAATESVTEDEPASKKYTVSPVTSKTHWQRLCGDIEKLPLEQAWHFGEASAKRFGGDAERYVVNEGDTPVACWQALTRPAFLGFSLTQVLRAPVLLNDISLYRDSIAPMLQQYGWHRKKWFAKSCPDTLPRKNVLFWLPEYVQSEYVQSEYVQSEYVQSEYVQSGHLESDREQQRKTEQALKHHKCRRMRPGYVSSWLSLQRPLGDIRAGLHGKWRNQLNRSAAYGLEIKEVKGGLLRDWVLNQHDIQRKSKRYAAPAAEFVKLLQPITLVAIYEGLPVAGICLPVHGNAATYYISVTTLQGRDVYAHNALLWHGIEILHKRGIKWLDLGGMGDGATPGIDRFKRRVGGDEFQLVGSYAYI